ncbi:hypothetical protein LCGC14_2712410 [marine sediment metagenome]|uniref:Uncharacterized protein n=1 Tax=marine sediment metagenome TaxID=412755 RepID=A0A0F8ZCM5_9ZZZZ
MELVLSSLSEEELRDVVRVNERKLISKGINSAFNMINSPMANTIKGFRIVNEKAGEIEIDFEWYKEASKTFVRITDENL